MERLIFADRPMELAKYDGSVLVLLKIGQTGRKLPLGRSKPVNDESKQVESLGVVFPLYLIETPSFDHSPCASVSAARFISRAGTILSVLPLVFRSLALSK